MELIKITPQKITKKVRFHTTSCQRSLGCVCSEKIYENINILPIQLENKLIKNEKKFNIIFVQNNKSYFSYHYNQMLIDFSYNLQSFTNIKIENEILTFKTDFGNYTINELLITVLT